MEYFGNKNFTVPNTEGIKYVGSKLKILPYIVPILGELDGVKNVFDGFSGTTRVSQAFAQLGYKTTANDISFGMKFCMCLAFNVFHLKRRGSMRKSPFFRRGQGGCFVPCQISSA